MTDDSSRPGELIQRLFTSAGKAIGWWTRLEYEGPDRLIEPPALIVANHGFGGIFDLNAFAVAALAERLRPRDDVEFTFLTHQLAWTLGAGPYLEPAGARVANRESAIDALSKGQYVGVHWSEASALISRLVTNLVRRL